MPPLINVAHCLTYGSERLKPKSADQSHFESCLLLSYLTKRTKAELLSKPELELSKDEINQFKKLIESRLNHKPIAYITGLKEFYSLEFQVSPSVLIPRPETEFLVEEGIAHIPDGSKVLEIGTGSGCIAVSLKKHRPDLHIEAIDINEEGLALAKQNADQLLGKEHGILFSHDNLFPKKKKLYQAVISNPPYISLKEFNQLMPDVKDYEPKIALVGGYDGLIFYQMISEHIKNYLAPGGILLLEIGIGQAKDVEKIFFKRKELQVIAIKKDYAQIERVMIFQ